jgi:hypothetical protein
MRHGSCLTTMSAHAFVCTPLHMTASGRLDKGADMAPPLSKHIGVCFSDELLQAGRGGAVCQILTSPLSLYFGRLKRPHFSWPLLHST